MDGLKPRPLALDGELANFDLGLRPPALEALPALLDLLLVLCSLSHDRITWLLQNNASKMTCYAGFLKNSWKQINPSAHLVIVDMKDLGVFLEHARGSENPSLETMMIIGII